MSANVFETPSQLAGRIAELPQLPTGLGYHSTLNTRTLRNFGIQSGAQPQFLIVLTLVPGQPENQTIQHVY